MPVHWGWIMSSETSFEVQSFKDGGWKTEAVCRDKQDALAQARDILSGRHANAAKVIEETFDSETGNSRYKIVFKEEKGAEKKPKYRKIDRKKSEPAIKTAPAPKRKKKESATKAIVRLVVVLGGLLLGGTALIAVYITYFGPAQ